MVAMTNSTGTLPWGRPLTSEDLAAMPDDGHRYELLDGVLLVSPSPRLRHQVVVGELFVRLRAAAPTGLQVLVAPLDVVLAGDTVLIPDLIVARREDFTEHNLPVPPLLAVEVLSPSTRRFDLMVKRSRLEAAGCPAYWVFDPDEVRLIAWELRAGAYVEVADVRGEQQFDATLPFPVTVTPVDLLAQEVAGG